MKFAPQLSSYLCFICVIFSSSCGRRTYPEAKFSTQISTDGAGSRQVGCLTSETEPNDDTKHANKGLCSSVPVSGVIASESDYDWFELNVSSPGEIKVTLAYENGIDLDWYLYQSSGTYVAYKSTQDNPEVGSYTAKSAGVYYVRVKSYKGAGKYTLTVVLPSDATSPSPTPPPTPNPNPIPSPTPHPDPQPTPQPPPQPLPSSKPCTLPSGVDLGKVGNSNSLLTTTASGFVLAGGGADVDQAFKWMIEKSGGGDFVVLRSSGTNAYNSYIYDLGGVNSVQTLLVNSSAQGNDACVAQTIKNAAALFVAGGNQQNYVDYFKGTATGEAINYLINSKHAPVGGTSAGMAILGQYYHPGGAPDDDSVLSNPVGVAVGTDFLKIPILAGVVTEPHFAQRNRQPRIVSFMASAISHLGANWQDIKAITADEGTAFLLDANGIGTACGSGHVTFIKANGAPEVLSKNRALTWNLKGRALSVYELSGANLNSNSFDVTNWKGTGGAAYFWYVDNGTLTH